MNTSNIEGIFHLALPFISSDFGYEPVGKGNKKDIDHVVTRLRRYGYSARLIEFVDYPGISGFHAPTYTRSRFGGVVSISFDDRIFQTDEVEVFLAERNFDLRKSSVEVIYFGYGIGILDFQAYFETSIGNLDSACETLEALRARYLSNERIENYRPLYSLLRKFSQAIPSSVQRRLSWPSLIEGRIKRLSPYSISMAILMDCAPQSGHLDAMKLASVRFCGTDRYMNSYEQDDIFAHFAGYDGQVCWVSKEKLYLATSLWRLCILNWSTLKEGDLQLGKLTEEVALGTLPMNQVKKHLATLSISATFLRSIRKEGSAEAVADHELERSIYTPTWKCWDGDSLADRILERITLSEQTLTAKRQDLLQTSTRLMNGLLFVIAILSTSSLSELAFRHFVALNLIDKTQDLLFETIFLVGMFVIALIILAWPRKR